MCILGQPVHLIKHHLQKSIKKSDDSNPADIGVYQDIKSATVDPSGKMCLSLHINWE